MAPLITVSWCFLIQCHLTLEDNAYPTLILLYILTFPKLLKSCYNITDFESPVLFCTDKYLFWTDQWFSGKCWHKAASHAWKDKALYEHSFLDPIMSSSPVATKFVLNTEKLANIHKSTFIFTFRQVLNIFWNELQITDYVFCLISGILPFCLVAWKQLLFVDLLLYYCSDSTLTISCEELVHMTR